MALGRQHHHTLLAAHLRTNLSFQRVSHNMGQGVGAGSDGLGPDPAVLSRPSGFFKAEPKVH